ncbi:hypothetical protein FLPS103535_03365 [Flavobacterium psychrophilum]
MVTGVSAATSAGVYVVPKIVPPPESTDQVPPAGVAVNALAVFSQIAAVLVVLVATMATVGTGVTEDESLVALISTISPDAMVAVFK